MGRWSLIYYSLLPILLLEACTSRSKKHAAGINRADSLAIQELFAKEYAYEPSHPDSALLLLDSARRMAIRLGDTEDLVYSYVYLSGVEASIGRHQNSRDAAREALRWAEPGGNRELVMAALSAFGNFYKKTDVFDSAAQYYIKAYELTDSTSKPYQVAALLNNIGVLLGQEGEADLAISYLKKSEEVIVPTRDTASILSIYQNIINNHPLRDRRDSLSRQYYMDRVLAIFAATDEYSNSLSLNFVAGALEEKNADSALKVYKKALRMAATDRNRDGEVFAAYNIGRIYHRKRAYDSAAFFLKLFSTLINPDSASLSTRIGYHSSMIDIYRHEHRLVEALAALDKMRVADSLLARRSKDELLFRHEKELTKLKAERQIARNEQRIREQRDRNLILVLAIVLTILGATFLLWGQRTRRKKMEQESRLRMLEARQKESELSNDLLQQEMAALFAQLNPHFVFNALNPLKSFLLRDQSKEALDYLGHLTVLMRAFINLSQIHFAPISDILDFLRHYVAVQRHRFGTSLQFVVVVEEGINPHAYMIPALMLQPLIENSLEHGIAGIRNAEVKLTIRMVQEQPQHLRISISDNGRGLPENDNAQPGHALEIIRSQLAIIAHQYGVGSLSVHNKEGEPGAENILLLPLIESN